MIGRTHLLTTQADPLEDVEMGERIVRPFRGLRREVVRRDPAETGNS